MSRLTNRVLSTNLGRRVRDADVCQDLVEVVRGKTVARPLGEKGNCNDDVKTLPVTLGGEQGLPANICSNCRKC